MMLKAAHQEHLWQLKVWYGLIEPMHSNKPRITYLLWQSSSCVTTFLFVVYQYCVFMI